MIKCIKVVRLFETYSNRVFKNLDGFVTTQDLANFINKLCPSKMDVDKVLETILQMARDKGAKINDNTVCGFHEYLLGLLGDESIFIEVPSLTDESRKADARRWDIYRSLVTELGRNGKWMPDEMTKYAYKVASTAVQYFAQMEALEDEKDCAKALEKVSTI